MDKYLFQEKLLETLKIHTNEIAIERGETSITYRHLAEISEGISVFFDKKIKQKNEKVGILLNDNIIYIEIMVALLRRGHIIVPFYPGYPQERLKAMMDTIDLKYIIIDDQNLSYFKSKNIDLNLENVWNSKDIFTEGFMTSEAKENINSSGEEPSYIHFTSGTTGKPKAVVGKNKSLLHYLSWLYTTFKIEKGSRVAQFAIPGFDPFLKETLGTLLNGGTVCIPEDINIIKDSYQLKAWIDEQEITHIHCVSSLFRLLNNSILNNDDFTSLKYILLAGEKINPEDLKKWYKIFDERITLVNCYGPTETTMSKLFYYIKKEDVDLERIPIGKPMNGAQILILDDNMKVCDFLVPGEIYIRTPYRSCGYYNDNKLTNEKFIKNPFSNNDNDLIYKTGDVGRYLLDGNVDILGRVDRQVKIHGYRIELEEIESLILKASDQVYETVVIKKELSEFTDSLYAFISIKNSEIDKNIFVKNIKKYLQDKLPAYMVPSVIIILNTIQRNERGKIDYNALQEIDIKSNLEYKAPETYIQKELVSIWQEILGHQRISIDDSFIQLGGNSLNIMSLISKIASVFEVRVPLGVIFQNDTIRKQEMIIQDMKNIKMNIMLENENSSIQVDKEYDLSYAQKSIWILSKLQNETAYNIPFKLEILGDFDIGIAEKAISLIIKKHSILRTTFIERDGIPKQRINNFVDFRFEYKDFSEYTVEEKNYFMNNNINKYIDYKFNLEKEQLLKGIVFKMENNRFILLMNIYHIIFDGYSMGIFSEEFSKYYNAIRANVSIDDSDNVYQYVNYVNDEIIKIEKGELEANRKYWVEQLKEPTNQLNLNGFYSTSEKNEFEAAIFEFMIDDQLRRKIINTAKEHECTIFMVLLSGFFTLLYKLTYVQDIIIGVPFNGRIDEKLKKVIGFFVNTLPIRIHFDQLSTFNDLIYEVKRLCINGYEKEYPFDKLVSELNPNRSLGKSPYFSTVFIFHNNPLSIKLDGLKVDVKEFLVRNVKHDFKIDMQEGKECIVGRFEYKKNKFTRDIIKNMKEDYISILEYICADSNIKIIDVFGENEQLGKQLGIQKLD